MENRVNQIETHKKAFGIFNLDAWIASSYHTWLEYKDIWRTILITVHKPMVVRKAFFLFFEKNAQKTPQKNAQKKRLKIKKKRPK